MVFVMKPASESVSAVAAPPLLVQATQLREVSGAPRLVAGTTISAQSGKITSSLIAAGAGPAAAIEVVAQATAQMPEAAARLLQPITGEIAATEKQPAISARALTLAGNRLAELQAAVVRELLTVARVPADRVLALVVHDPGMWFCSEDRVTGYSGVSNAPQLAHLSGLNVLDALPARDFAAGGIGGPITALAEARLLQTRHRSTLFVDFGRTLRATYIPAESLSRGRAEKRPRVLSFQIGPGMQLIDALAQKFSGGAQSIDAGGRLAVQGQHIPELLVHWQRNAYFDRPLPRWHPAGVSCEPFLNDAYQLAVKSSWSVRDLLCTATHFVAHLVADTALRRLPAGYPVDDVVLAGGGVQNGLLMRQVSARLPKLPIARVAERICPAEVFESAALAAVGLMTIDHQPTTLPEITGAQSGTIAGRFTPGTTMAWRRLLAELAAAPQAGLALRNAS